MLVLQFVDMILHVWVEMCVGSPASKIKSVGAHNAWPISARRSKSCRMRGCIDILTIKMCRYHLEWLNWISVNFVKLLVVFGMKSYTQSRWCIYTIVPLHWSALREWLQWGSSLSAWRWSAYKLLFQFHWFQWSFTSLAVYKLKEHKTCKNVTFAKWVPFK